MIKKLKCILGFHQLTVLKGNFYYIKGNREKIEFPNCKMLYCFRCGQFKVKGDRK